MLIFHLQQECKGQTPFNTFAFVFTGLLNHAEVLTPLIKEQLPAVVKC
jgi:hypothetical protein